jgi:deoxyxylulose-5-phosphate synthase
MYLEKIQGPDDVKKLSMEQLNVLAGEMREAFVNPWFE